MDLQNRFGDDLEKGGGLLGPDGQPLASTSEAAAKDETVGAAEPQLDFFN